MWVCGLFYCEYLEVSCYLACHQCSILVSLPLRCVRPLLKFMQKASGFLSGVGIHKLGGRWVRYIAEERDYFKKICFSFNLHFIIKIFLACAYIHWITYTVLGDRFELCVIQQGCYTWCWCHHFPHIHLHGYFSKLHVAVITVSVNLFCCSPNSHSEEHQLVMWGLVFFLLENVEEQIMDTEVAPAVLQLALTLVTANNLPPSVHLALLQVRSYAILCEYPHINLY